MIGSYQQIIKLIGRLKKNKQKTTTAKCGHSWSLSAFGKVRFLGQWKLGFLTSNSIPKSTLLSSGWCNHYQISAGADAPVAPVLTVTLTMVLFNEKLSKNYSIFGRFFTENHHSVPKSVSWRSNQELRSICADTVLFFSVKSKLDIIILLHCVKLQVRILRQFSSIKIHFCFSILEKKLICLHGTISSISKWCFTRQAIDYLTALVNVKKRV